jgi:hypothetical protein
MDVYLGIRDGSEPEKQDGLSFEYTPKYNPSIPIADENENKQTNKQNKKKTQKNKKR